MVKRTTESTETPEIKTEVVSYKGGVALVQVGAKEEKAIWIKYERIGELIEELKAARVGVVRNVLGLESPTSGENHET